MDQISFRCPSCDRPFHVPADKAGRKARCKCGAQVVVPSAAEDEGKISLAEGPAAPRSAARDQGEENIALAGEGLPRLALDEGPGLRAADPTPLPRLALDEGEELLPPEPKSSVPSPASDGAAGSSLMPPPPAVQDDEEEGAYNLLAPFEEPPAEEAKRKGGEEEEEGEEGEEEKKEEEDEEAFRRKRPVGKTIPDQDKWRQVEKGLFVVAIGIVIWVAALGLQRLVVLIGALSPMEYAGLAENDLVNPDEIPEAGQGRSLHRAYFAIDLVAGSGFATFADWIIGIAIFLSLVQVGVTAVGYFMCLKVPNRYGTRGQVIALLSVAGASFFVTFLFKFLPMTGLMRYTLIPFLAPEVGMLQLNTQRLEPVHITWGGAPFIELFFTILFQMVVLAEPVLVAIFLRGIGTYLKVDSLLEASEGLIRLGLGTAFTWVAYLLLMNAGTSEPLLLTLRAIYVLGTAFFLGQLIWLALVLVRSRESIERMLKVGWVA
jgi:hypothetical protein